jgi:hypothetical protein
MKMPVLSLLCAVGILLAGCQNPSPLSPAEKARYGEMLRSGKVRTSFEKGARLSVSRQLQVLALAEGCGIREPSVIRSGRTVPIDGLVVSVNGADRVEGRSRFFESIPIYEAGWIKEWEDKVENIQRVGRFWADGDEKTMEHLRRYDFWGKPIEISISQSVDVASADRIVALLDAKRVRFPGESAGMPSADRLEFDGLAERGFQPVGISKSSSEGCYGLGFYSPSRGSLSLDVRLEEESVVVESIARIHF